jgi:hypothetical protein
MSAHFCRSLGCVICIEDEKEFPPGSHVVMYRDATGARVSKSQYKSMTFAAHLGNSAIWSLRPFLLPGWASASDHTTPSLAIQPAPQST